MSDEKISELTAVTTLADDDEIPAVDTSATETKRITWANIKTAIQTLIEGLASYFNVSTDTLDDITDGATYVKSTNDFTDADHSKLDGIEVNATADQTGAEIKTAYEGEADTNAYTDAEKTKLAGVEVSADVTDATNVGSSIHGTSGKTTPVDADTVGLIDSAASNVLKKLTWANIKATLKTYFDTLYGDMNDLVDDTTPQLGGDLDLNGNNIDFPTTPNISDCLDEDDMASDSATKLATQQSIKAYADTMLPKAGGTMSGDITMGNNDIDNAKTVQFNGEYDNGNSSTAKTISFDNGQNQKVTLTGNCTFTFTAPTSIGTFKLKLIQDGTGSRTVTWPATVKWPGGTAPTLTTDASAIDIISFYYDGTNYYAVEALDFS